MTRSIATIAPDTETFFVPKGRVRVLLLAIIALQKRDDLSGKFAKKLRRMRRAMAAADEEIVEEQNDTLEAFTVKDAEGNPVPVYAETEDGKPVFKKDDKGHDTEERIAVPNRFQLTDAKQYQEVLKAMSKEIVAVECSSFRATGEGVPELELFKAVRGEIIDALADLEEGSEVTLTVPEQVEALRAQIVRVEAQIAKLEAPPVTKPTLVQDSPVAEPEGETETVRSAP